MKNSRPFSLTIILSSIIVLFTGCNYMPDWVGSVDEKKLAGERISILPQKSQIQADTSLKDLETKTPEQAENKVFVIGSEQDNLDFK